MTVVFKLGGSLLTLPDLAERLKLAVNQRGDRRCLVVVGGGASADVVRDWSRIHGLDDESAHWLAISSLDLNRLLIERLLGWTSVTGRDEATMHWSRNPLATLLKWDQFLRDEESKTKNCLPHDWGVTSDSLAAWTAIRWPASELVLLKSVPTPCGLTVQEASRESLVDPWFVHLAPQIERISWCNLRGDKVVIQPWMRVQRETI